MRRRITLALLGLAAFAAPAVAASSALAVPAQAATSAHANPGIYGESTATSTATEDPDRPATSGQARRRALHTDSGPLSPRSHLQIERPGVCRLGRGWLEREAGLADEGVDEVGPALDAAEVAADHGLEPVEGGRGVVAEAAPRACWPGCLCGGGGRGPGRRTGPAGAQVRLLPGRSDCSSSKQTRVPVSAASIVPWPGSPLTTPRQGDAGGGWGSGWAPSARRPSKMMARYRCHRSGGASGR